jgi:uncharacterized protein YdaT
MTAKPRNSKKPTLKVQLENEKAKSKALEERKATLDFDFKEINMLRLMCSHMEDFYKNHSEGDVSDLNSIAKEYNEEQMEIVRNIYFKASFK